MSSLPTGPLGKRRGTLLVILVGIVTFGIYWIYWAFKTHDEMKRHTGEGSAVQGALNRYWEEAAAARVS